MDISIIISTRNRSHLFRKTLESFKKLDTEGIDWEILVVDNASNDSGETMSLLMEYESKLPLTILSEPIPGKNRALNKAIPLASGELFVFTDNDVIVDPMWLKSFWKASKRWLDADVFGGRIIPLFPENTPDWVKNGDTISKGFTFGYFSPDENEGVTSRIPMGANLAIRSSIFERFSYMETVGPSGNHYPMGSETTLLVQLQNHNIKFVYVPLACVQHIIEGFQLQKEWLLQRIFRLGWGKAVHMEVSNKRQIKGIPFYIIRKTIISMFLYYFFLFFPPVKRLYFGMKYFFYKGIIYGLIKKQQEDQSTH